MITSPLLTSRKGFSILVALGTTGVLLIIVIGIATLFQNEMQLSRWYYDSIISYSQAEGAFEYGMLKVTNHREGFSDTVKQSDVDGKILLGSTERTRNRKTGYTITASAREKQFSLSPEQYLVIPLFVGKGDPLSGDSQSPLVSRETQKVSSFRLTGVGIESVSWSIIAMKNGQNTSITGVGPISDTTEGVIRTQTSECYNQNGEKIPTCQGYDVAEELSYFYDTKEKVTQFLSEAQDAYLMIFNNTSTQKEVTLSSSENFGLPDLTLTAESEKGNARQVIRFYRDNSGYYDALKYGVYDTEGQ